MIEDVKKKESSLWVERVRDEIDRELKTRFKYEVKTEKKIKNASR